MTFVLSLLTELPAGPGSLPHEDRQLKHVPHFNWRFTELQMATYTVSWLDHCVCTCDAQASLVTMETDQLQDGSKPYTICAAMPVIVETLCTIPREHF